MQGLMVLTAFHLDEISPWSPNAFAHRRSQYG